MYQRVGMSLAVALTVGLAACSGNGNKGSSYDPAPGITTATPIKHLVVIFGENISFDHYFGTYPYNVNTDTPTDTSTFTLFRDDATVPDAINNYLADTTLLTANPNYVDTANYAAYNTYATNPFLLPTSRAKTASQDHSYNGEQIAFDGISGTALLDAYPYRGKADDSTSSDPTYNKGLVMGYYDGTTVTGFWNYAQRYALSDSSYGQFGPSTVGVINLIAGQTNGVNTAEATATAVSGSDVIDGGNDYYTVVADPSPLDDICSAETDYSGGLVRLSGQNIGDLLKDAGVTYGGFSGGFDLTRSNSDGSTGCLRTSSTTSTTWNDATISLVHSSVYDYVPHHAFFNYWASTANASHARPSCLTENASDYSCIGVDGDTANHNYDINDFFDAVNAGDFPAVSFLKAIKVEDGHASNSDPINEQAFVIRVINFLQQRSDWKNTAVVVLYDDSDGWYDHQAGPLVATSESSLDYLNSTSGYSCTTAGDQTEDFPNKPDASKPVGIDGSTEVDGRCGPGPRQPLLVISPWARQGYVDHNVTNQAAVIRFIEDNWLGGTRIGNGSWDSISLDGGDISDITENSIYNLFDFSTSSPGNATKLLLACDGTITTTAPTDSATGANDACALE
ncbi:MAG: alkaline phosphatase family protein [Solimonas sp.]